MVIGTSFSRVSSDNDSSALLTRLLTCAETVDQVSEESGLVPLVLGMLEFADTRS